jgi:hypothetical protein
VAPPGAGPPAFVAGSVAWRSVALAPEEAPAAPELAPLPAPPPVGPALPPDAIIAPAARPDFIPSPAPAESPPGNPAPRAAGEAEKGRVDAPDPSHENARPTERAAKPQRPPVPAAKPAKRTPSGVAANAPEAKKGAKPAAGTGSGEKESASGEGACRPYVSEQTMMGGEAAVIGTVCRGADGRWRLVSQYYNGD